VQKLLMLCGALLCLSMTAAAQDAAAGFDATSPAAEPAAPVPFQPPNRASWQVGIGFQYQHYRALGQSVHDQGFNTDVTRYLNDWFGLEGAVAAGWGHTGAPFNIDANSVFVGGGAHFAVHNTRRAEPWAHVLVGLQHFRFAETGPAIGLNSNSALGFRGGGGMDFKLNGRTSWRVEADYIGTHFRSAWQTNYSFGTGLVFNF
jgi:hypothetical protein